MNKAWEALRRKGRWLPFGQTREQLTDRELVQVARHIEVESHKFKDTSQLQLNKTEFSSGASVHRYFLFTEVAAVIDTIQIMQAARRSESRSAVSLVINPESSQSQHRNIRKQKTTINQNTIIKHEPRQQRIHEGKETSNHWRSSWRSELCCEGKKA
jgi:hypothetical protein